MTVFNGKSVYGAIVSGCVCVLKKPPLHAEKRTIEDTAEEIRRFNEAKETAVSQLQELYDMYIDQIGEPNAPDIQYPHDDAGRRGLLRLHYRNDH